MVDKWLHKGGSIDALCSIPHLAGGSMTRSLLQIAVICDDLEIVRKLLKRGASIDLQNSVGATALMNAAYLGHLSTVLVLLQHSANPDLQGILDCTALFEAAGEGHDACVKALLRAKANTELVNIDGRTALQWAKIKGHAATAELTRQHTAFAATVASPPEVIQAAQPTQAARADEAMEELLAEEAAEQAKGQAPSKKSKKKKKAGRVIAAGYEPSEAPSAAAPAPPPAAAPRPAVSAAGRVAAEGAAVAKADALERATADGDEGSNTGAAGPSSEASKAAEVPDDYMCPITAEIMTDPVCAADGFTYERTAISEWLRTKDTSPFTGATLESKFLFPNYSLRNVIRSFVEALAAPTPTLTPPSVLSSAEGS